MKLYIFLYLAIIQEDTIIPPILSKQEVKGQCHKIIYFRFFNKSVFPCSCKFTISAVLLSAEVAVHCAADRIRNKSSYIRRKVNQERRQRKSLLLWKWRRMLPKTSQGKPPDKATQQQQGGGFQSMT